MDGPEHARLDPEETAAATLPSGCAVFLTYTDIIKPVDAAGETIASPPVTP